MRNNHNKIERKRKYIYIWKKKKRKEEIKGQKKIYIKYECFWEREKKKKKK